MNFSVEEIKLLAESERRMDSGESPFVLIEGNRMSVMPLVMDEFGLETGQTVTNGIVIAILEAQIAAVKAQIEARQHIPQFGG